MKADTALGGMVGERLCEEVTEFEPIPGRYEREPDENGEEGWTDWEQPVQRPCGRRKHDEFRVLKKAGGAETQEVMKSKR